MLDRAWKEQEGALYLLSLLDGILESVDHSKEEVVEGDGF